MTKKRSEETCFCPAYKFPHREGGGRCNGSDAYWCDDCHEECIPEKVDLGIGTTEAWGVVSTHRDVQWVSNCCHASFTGGDE